ncbi:MAG: aldehyde dehydrogenase family protein [Calditrichaeota bacterium]|nr:aldehyde dehydrogenase family protein [Calditrichota bacterium]
MQPDQIIQRARQAAVNFSKFGQIQTDKIVRAVYLAALDNRIRLAKLAAAETDLGLWQHKVIKNVIASQLVYDHIKRQKTVGIISEDPISGIIEMAHPIGPILALVPVINPTSTTIYKILIALKTRNPLIVSSAFAAKDCVAETCRICYAAALAAGAPEHCIQWLAKPNLASTKELMSHRGLALILATGTGDIVKAGYSSGTPTLGVGAGNVPVYIGVTADIPFAVRSIMMSKTFDNGSICASEQAIIVRRKIAVQVISEFKKAKAYFLTPDEIDKVGKIAYDFERKTMAARVVGQPVSRIAEMADISIPPDTTVLIAKLDAVDYEHPLSAEILAPILALYIESSFKAAIGRCVEIANFGGVGHTAVIYSNNPERIEYFADNVDVARILVNTPSTQGALGGMFTALAPSFTLSCGSGGKNSTTDNISTRNLLNIHRICRRRVNERWLNMNFYKYLDESYDAARLEREFNKNS